MGGTSPTFRGALPWQGKFPSAAVRRLDGLVGEVSKGALDMCIIAFFL